MIATRNSLINQQQTDTQLQKISHALQLIFSSQTSKLSFQKTYHSVYRLCRQGMYVELGDLAIKRATDYFRFVVDGLKMNQGRVGETVSQTINDLMEVSQRILEVFLYLEANHRQREGAPSLRVVFNNILFETLTKREGLMQKFVYEIAELKIAGDIEGARKMINLISSIDQQEKFISSSFLPVYIPRMADFFSKVAVQKVNKSDLRQYLNWAIEMLNIEKEFMARIVSSSKTEGKSQFDLVMNEIYSIVVSEQKSKIYQLDPKLLFTTETPTILELFNIISQSDVKGHIDWYINVVRTELAALNRTHNQHFLENFIRFYQRVNEYLSKTTKNFSISYKVKFIFEEWINQERINIPYRLNLYINSNLSENQNNKENSFMTWKNTNESTNSTFIQNFEILFKLLKKKDEFERCYRKMIVKRKIQNMSDDGQEERLIKIMGQECGMEWIAKMENLRRSIKEHNNSSSSMKSKGNGNGSGNRMNAVIFEDAAWPYEKENFNSILAKELEQMAQEYEKKSSELNNKKKVKWHPTLGTAVIGITFANGQAKNFLMDTCQANMMLYLKKFGKMKIEDFAKNNYFNTEQIKQPFKKLLKSELLICDAKSYLHLNENFLKTYPNAGQIDEINLMEDESEDSIETVGMEELKADRKLMVEAMLIKIMKSAKVATRQEILKRIVPGIEGKGFKYNKEFVQQAVERLIEKEYIRDFEDGSLGYIA